MKTKRIKISFGGSHRKNARCLDRLRPFLSGSSILPRYQSKVLEAVAYDTPELRELLKALGGSVCRHQPEWLNANHT